MNKFRWVIFTTVLLIITLFSTVTYLFYSEIDKDELNFVHKYLVNSAFNKFEERIGKLTPDAAVIVNYDSLFNSLNYFELKIVAKIFTINPAELGFKGKKYPTGGIVTLRKIENKVLDSAKKIETGINYLPVYIFKDYERMVISMEKELGRRLYIDSGYRSPGRQAYLFLKYLISSNDYSLIENAKWIAMPGYSEHGSSTTTAIDFISEGGINGFTNNQTAKDFESLQEFQWLTKNASTFNFFMSYPPNNPYGVAYEPWHWHWEGEIKNSYPTISEAN